MLTLPVRPRRNRRTAVQRAFARETTLDASRFIWPVFIHAGEGRQAIRSMPGCFRLSAADLDQEVAEAVADGITSVVLFPAIDEAL